MMEFYNLTFERSVLSSIIFDPSQFDELKAVLNLEDFYISSHQDIYSAMRDLAHRDMPIEEGFLCKVLSEKNKFNERVMLEILTANPIADTTAYVYEIKELAKKRQLESLVHSFKSDLYDESINATELLTITLKRLEIFQETRRVSLFEKHDITSIKPEEAGFICRDWLPFPKKTVSLISAPGGNGKSWMVLQIMMRHLIDVPTAKAFAWLAEDDKGLTAHRSEKIASSIVAKPLEFFKGRMEISDSPTFQVLLDRGRGVEVSSYFNDFKKTLREYELIVLDPLIAFFGVDENNNSHARKFMQLFTEWASKESKTVVFIHHSTKNTTQSRGASAFIDSVRLAYEVSAVTDKKGDVDETCSHLRKISLVKDNYGATKLLGGKIFSRQIFPQTIENKTTTRYEIVGDVA